jgi:hypothetical protein
MLDTLDLEVLFPPRLIPVLGDERGEDWKKLIAKVQKTSGPSLERAAFVLMMVRISGCNTCHANSFRALQGCDACARQSLRRFRGGDQELLKNYEQAKQDVVQYLTSRDKSEVTKV